MPGLVVGVAAQLNALLQVGFGMHVGHPRRQLGVRRAKGDLDQTGTLYRCNLQPVDVGINEVGGNLRDAACGSTGSLPAVCKGGLSNGPPQPTGSIPPDVCASASLTRLRFCKLSGRVSGQGSTGTSSARLLLPGRAGAAERLVLPATVPLEFAGVSGAVPRVTEMTSEVLPVAFVTNNCIRAPAELRAIICASSSSERIG